MVGLNAEQFQAMDDRNYPPDGDAHFIHDMGDPEGNNPAARSQMAMQIRGSSAYHNVRPDRPDPWAHTVQERPKPQGHQLPLPLEGPGAVPTDRDLHRLRQANPHLNDYQFRAKGGGRSGEIAVEHPVNGLVGTLRFDGDSASDNHQEIDMIQVHPKHKGKGLAEGMYDYANAKGANLIHSSNRSEEGEAFARRTGGPAHTRTEGIYTEKYGTRWEPGK